jgi:hypothetical protein
VFAAGARWAFCGGLAVSVLAMAAIHVGSVHSLRDRDVWLRVAVAVAALGLAALETSALLLVPVSAGILVALVAVEVAGHRPDVADGVAAEPD